MIESKGNGRKPFLQKRIQMIDPIVAYDKLSNFETAQEIREYFQECGIKADRSSSSSCAISEWFKETTGEKFVSVGISIKVGTKVHELQIYGPFNIKNHIHGQLCVAADPEHNFRFTPAIL